MKKTEFAFSRINFLLLAAGMAVIIIGFILMAAVLFGFTFYQNSQARKQYALNQQQDSIARAEAAAAQAELQADLQAEEPQPQSAAPAPRPQQARIYKDAGLDAARKGEEQILTLSNDLFEVKEGKPNLFAVSKILATTSQETGSLDHDTLSCLE